MIGTRAPMLARQPVLFAIARSMTTASDCRRDRRDLLDVGRNRDPLARLLGRAVRAGPLRARPAHRPTPPRVQAGQT